jgi:hypothetical protein
MLITLAPVVATGRHFGSRLWGQVARGAPRYHRLQVVGPPGERANRPSTSAQAPRSLRAVAAHSVFAAAAVQRVKAEMAACVSAATKEKRKRRHNLFGLKPASNSAWCVSLVFWHSSPIKPRKPVFSIRVLNNPHIFVKFPYAVCISENDRVNVSSISGSLILF